MNSLEPAIEELMRSALAGDSGAYNLVLKHITKIVRPFLSNRLKQKSDIEDVLQDILLSVHRARHTYDGVRPFQPWLFAIARYRLQDHFRRWYSDKLRTAVDVHEVDEILFLNSNDSPVAYEYLYAEIEQLSGKSAEILRLLHREGHTANEAAQILGMQESAVKVAAHRAYKVLRKKLVD